MNMQWSSLISLFFLISLSVSVAKPSTIIWQESFAGGLDEWRLFGFSTNDLSPLSGNFSVAEGILSFVGDENQENVAEHPSTLTVGTWSFDLHVTTSPRNHFYVAFFGEKMGNLTEVDNFSDIIAYEYGVIPVTASFGMWDSEFVFYRRSKGASSVTELGSFSPSEILGWHHFDITRNSQGEFNVLINGTHVNTFQDLQYTTTEVFRMSGGPGPGIDNIVIKDDFDVETSAKTTSTTNIVELLTLSLLVLELRKRIKKSIIV